VHMQGAPPMLCRGPTIDSPSSPQLQDRAWRARDASAAPAAAETRHVGRRSLRHILQVLSLSHYDEDELLLLLLLPRLKRFFFFLLFFMFFFIIFCASLPIAIPALSMPAMPCAAPW